MDLNFKFWRKPSKKRETMDITKAGCNIMSGMLQDALWIIDERLLRQRYDITSSELERYKDFMVCAGILKIAMQDGKVDGLEITDKGRKFIEDCKAL